MRLDINSPKNSADTRALQIFFLKDRRILVSKKKSSLTFFLFYSVINIFRYLSDKLANGGVEEPMTEDMRSK